MPTPSVAFQCTYQWFLILFFTPFISSPNRTHRERADGMRWPQPVPPPVPVRRRYRGLPREEPDQRSGHAARRHHRAVSGLPFVAKNSWINWKPMVVISGDWSKTTLRKSHQKRSRPTGGSNGSTFRTTTSPAWLTMPSVASNRSLRCRFRPAFVRPPTQHYHK